MNLNPYRTSYHRIWNYTEDVGKNSFPNVSSFLMPYPFTVNDEIIVLYTTRSTSDHLFAAINYSEFTVKGSRRW